LLLASELDLLLVSPVQTRAHGAAAGAGVSQLCCGRGVEEASRSRSLPPRSPRPGRMTRGPGAGGLGDRGDAHTSPLLPPCGALGGSASAARLSPRKNYN